MQLTIYRVFVPPRRVLVVRRRFKTDHSLVGKICRYSTLSGQHVCTKPMSNIGKKRRRVKQVTATITENTDFKDFKTHSPPVATLSVSQLTQLDYKFKKMGSYRVVQIIVWLGNVIVVYELLRHSNCAFN